MPTAPERPPRRDDTAADAGSLARMGRIDLQPAPKERPEPPRPTPPRGPVPDPVDEAEALQLSAALTEAGITPAAEDQAAVQQLAKLDAATVAVVQGWLKRGKPATPGSGK